MPHNLAFNATHREHQVNVLLRTTLKMHSRKATCALLLHGLNQCEASLQKGQSNAFSIRVICHRDRHVNIDREAAWDPRSDRNASHHAPASPKVVEHFDRGLEGFD